MCVVALVSSPQVSETIPWAVAVVVVAFESNYTLNDYLILILISNSKFFQRWIEHFLHMSGCMFKELGVICNDVVDCLILCLGIQKSFICIFRFWMCGKNRNDLRVSIECAQLFTWLLQLNNFIWFGTFVNNNCREK